MLDKKTQLIKTIQGIKLEHNVKDLLLEHIENLQPEEVSDTLEKLVLGVLFLLTDYEATKWKAQTYDDIVKISEAHQKELDEIDTKLAQVEEEVNPPQVG